MGVVTARAAGVLDVVVCSPPGADGEIDRTILGTCRLCGVERVYRIGGAQAIAALAYGTETVGRVDVIVGPGNLYVQEAKRQLAATRRDRRLRRAERPRDRARRAGRRARAWSWPRSTCSPRPSTGRAASSWRSRRTRRLWTALAEALERLVVTRPTVGEAACALVADAGRARGGRARERARARAPGADRRRRGGARAAGALLPARCSWARAARPRSATTWPAPTTCCRRAAPRALPRGCRRGTSAGGCRRCGSARMRSASSRRRARRSRAPRGSRCTPSRWRRACGENSRHLQ